jgi:arsenite-transporting ATPase
MAAAFALRCAQAGNRTLLVSTDPAHSTSDILETELGSSPKRIDEMLWAMEISPEDETSAYIEDVKRRIAESTAPRLVAEVERQIDIARISPGAEESALFERFTKIIDSEGAEFDRLIFDTAPTGHTLRLLSLPELMTVWISGLISQRRKVNVLGKMWRNVSGAAASEVEHEDPVLKTLEQRRTRFALVREILTDGARAAFVFVIIPEKLPIFETARAAAALEKYGVKVGGIIVNQVLPASVEGRFLTRRKEREGKYLQEIRESFQGHRLVEVPLFEADVVGREALLHVADSLAVMVESDGDVS